MKEKIEKLRDQLVSNDDFHATFTYFFTSLAMDQNFMKKGEALGEAPKLSTAITKTMESLYQHLLETPGIKPRSGNDTMAFVGVNYIKEYGLYHGPIKITSGMGSYFYFEKEGMGLMMVKFLESPKMWYSRFTTIEHDGDAIPYIYPMDPNSRN